MSILLQKKNVGDYSYMSSPNIYYRAELNIVNVTLSRICRVVSIDTSGCDNVSAGRSWGEGRPPHIPPQTDPTVGLLRNMWRSSRLSANYQKAIDFL